MSNMQAAERQSLTVDFVQAVAARDFDRADRLLPDLPAAVGDGVSRSVAVLHMQRERWEDAADVLSILAAPDMDTHLRRQLCRNLAAIKLHRPEVYRVLADSDLADAYTLHPTPSGKMTIAARSADGKLTLLNSASDPAAAVAQAMRQLAPASQQGDCLALFSVGDGYMLDAIARQSPELQLGRRQAVYVFEPDARLLLACLLLHDFTGETGPIERQNLLWFVGPRWAEAFKLASHTDRHLPFPKVTIKQALDPKPIETVLAAALESLGRIDTHAQQTIDRHYAPLGPDAFAAALRGKAGRPPRVLLVTTRFSTVLQYSTRDAADAFRQIGFEAQVLIEPTPHHAITRLSIRRAVADFKPDLVFQIDHNRFEHGDLFPPNVPFVNWIQDLLPHLMTTATGRKLGENDFVLTPSLQRWVDEYAYPPRQCLEFRKLTRVPQRPISLASNDNRVVYVSNWSQSPGQISGELIDGASGIPREAVRSACERMISIYADGGSLYTPGDCRRLLVDVLDRQNASASEAQLSDMATRLFDRLNNLLFRQQGLRWAAAGCEQAGLTLEIYGSGWDRHPEFAAYARGRIGYGQELENLTRETAINLVLEPFVCVSHQRLLDALVAGGFCLVRHHPSNDLLHAMIDLVARSPDAGVETAAALARSLKSPDDRRQLQQTLDACRAIEASPGLTDFIASVRRQQREGFLPESGRLLPHLEAVSFSSPQQAAASLLRFSRDAELRAEIARLQRQSVEGRYGYAAGMARVVAFVSEALVGRSQVRTLAA